MIFLLPTQLKRIDESAIWQNRLASVKVLGYNQMVYYVQFGCNNYNAVGEIALDLLNSCINRALVASQLHFILIPTK